MKTPRIIYPTILLSFSAFATTNAQSNEVLRYGALSGRVLLSKSIPALPPLHLADTDIKDHEVCAAANLPDERLVVSAKNRGVANVFVWFERIDQETIHPDLNDVPPVEWSFKKCRLNPHVLCVRANQTFTVLNHDPISHLPHDYPLTNQPGCTLLVPTKSEAPATWKQHYQRSELLPIRFTCEIHPWISGYLLIQDHPYMTTTDKDGRFTIHKVPYGQHKLCIWHEVRGYIFRNEVSIGNAKTLLPHITIHLTKNEKTVLGIQVP